MMNYGRKAFPRPKSAVVAEEKKTWLPSFPAVGDSKSDGKGDSKSDSKSASSTDSKLGADAEDSKADDSKEDKRSVGAIESDVAAFLRAVCFSAVSPRAA